MRPNDIALFYNPKTGITTIQFGVLKIGDAAHAVRSLAMLYETHNQNPANASCKYSQATINGFWEFAAGLIPETENLGDDKQ